MKLILASNTEFLYEKGKGLSGIPLNEMRVAYVTTATNLKENKSRTENNKREMQTRGIYFEEFDINGKTLEELRTFFKDKNIIYVGGGDTCYLLAAARRSHFKEYLEEFFERGGVYIGTSAGGYIMGPSIETTFWKDPNKDWHGLTDLAGLGFAPFMIFAHYIDDMKNKITEKVAQSKYPVRILKDGQAMFCDNGKCSFVGEGEVLL